MSQSKLTTITGNKTPFLSIIILGLVFVSGIFIGAFDHGQIIGTVFAESGIDPMFLHELTHDMRHAAGLPCH